MSGQSDQKFVLDTNVFIQAHRNYYPFDFHPAFWKCLEHYHQKSRIRSIDKVREEILRGSGNGLKGQDISNTRLRCKSKCFTSYG